MSFGGHAPIEGQHVYLLQPGTTGYGSAATSILGTGTTTSPDGFTLMANGENGNTTDPNVPVGAMFETTDSGGNFNFTGAYSCTVGRPVYIYAWGGKISSTALNNNNIVQLATLGNCPPSGNFSSTLQFVFMNEVSTIATAYTFQPYTLVGNNDAWHIGSTNTTQGLLGIANAANTAAQLYDIQGGTQLSSCTGASCGEGHLANFQTIAGGTPNSGNGIVPQATIDTLANIVASCVDSAPTVVGTETSQCSGLFKIATNNGETGTAANEPIDTATAAINISRFPAGNNSATAVDATYASDIFALQTGTIPYVPNLSHAPNDWTIAINYPGLTAVMGSAGAQGVTNNTLSLAESIAVDDIGQLWITSQGEPNTTTGGFIINPDIVRWSNLGVQNAFTAPGAAAGAPYIPGYVSVDGSGNAWTGNANDAPAAAPYMGNGGAGTSIFEDGSNGVFTNANGSGFFKAYVVITDQTGDVFFFAGDTALNGNYDMWEYSPDGGNSVALTANSPINISGTSTTTITPTPGSINITSATETSARHNGVTTFTYTFTAPNNGANPLVAGPVTLKNLGNKTNNPNKGANWANLDGNQTVTAANANGFTITGTTDLNISGDEVGGTASYTNNVTTTTTTPGAVPAGDNVGHGAMDSTGALWVTSETPANTIARISSTGATAFTPITTAEQPEFPAIDHANNAWIAIQNTDSQIDVVSPTGGITTLTPTGAGGTVATGALMTSTFGSAVDGNGNVWFVNRAGNFGVVNGTNGAPAVVPGDNTVFVLNGGVTTPGTVFNAISPPKNYVPEAQYPANATTFTPMLDGSLNLAIDPSGNVWITDYSGGGVTEIVGAAAPVVTPLSVAAGTNQLGQKP